MSAHVPDSGLANERTSLSWQRTALALAVGSVIVLRLTVDELGLVAVLGASSAFGLATWVVVESQWRYSQAAGRRERRRGRGGRAPAFLATATVVLALIELVVVIRS